jgi:glycosyltransferase involved in cell wall biosynthesis
LSEISCGLEDLLYHKGMKVSVVIPAYDEEGGLQKLIPELFAVLGKDCEVLVVNDCSLDDTAQVSRAAGAKVLDNPYNMGNGAGVKRGIREATGDVVVLMDADGQHLASEIPKLLADIGKYDMVIGCRGKGAQKFWRQAANKAYNALASYVSNFNILDLTSGFRAFRRDKAIKFLYLLPNTFSYPSTLTLAFIKAAYSVKFVPVTVLARQSGTSKISILSDGARFFVIIMKIAVFFSPLKVFMPISVALFLTGISYYAYTFISAHRFTNMSALLFTTSIIIFMLGLVSEQIAQLRKEHTD